MGEYIFGVGDGRLAEKTAKAAGRIARRHGCWLVRYTEGDGSSPRYWFSGPNRGEPFDRDMAAAVKRDLIAAGVAGDDGRLPTKL